MMPDKREIARIAEQTGMDRMQAHYHAQGREILRLRLSSPNRAKRDQQDMSETPLFDPGLGL